MNIIQLPSLNFTAASSVPGVYGMARVTAGITIHHWNDPAARPTFDGTVGHLRNPASRVSAHYVAEAGRVAQLVQDRDAAWHAGSARGNATTIGIECSPYATDGDYATAAELIRELRSRYGPLPLYRHSDWTATACPGAWDLKRLDTLARGGGPTTPPPPEPVQAGPIQWIVDRGDTLSKIAEYYNGPSVAQIAAANGITNPDNIQEGQVLTIPGRLIWIVDRGNTLGQIAKYYAVSVDYIARLNNLRNPDDIREGQVLRIQ